MHVSRYLLLSLVAASLSPCIASAQSIPFQLRVQQGSNVVAVTNTGTLTIAANAIGQPLNLQFTAVYTGLSAASISNAALVGATDFSLTTVPSLPVSLLPGASFSLGIQYTPSAGNQVSGQFVLSYTEAAGTPNGAPGPLTQIFLNLVGTAPNFAFAYVLQSNNNTLALPSGGTVTFPPTTVNTSATASLIIMNIGTAAGNINSLTVAGNSFQISGLPLLPGSLAAGKNISVTLQYSPQTLGASTGTIQIGLPSQTATFSLAGTAIGASFTYQLVSSATTTPITPGQTISFVDTTVGATSNLAVQVTNSGTANGQINSINLLGAGFTLTNLSFLPITLTAGSSFTFTIQFAPTQPGTGNAKLQIGSDSFGVTGLGLGALLTYSYSSGANTVPILSAGAAIFSPSQIGQSSSSSFTVQNTGTSSGTLSSIAIVFPTQNSSPYFTLSNLPPLPVNLSPGAQFSFTVTFSPVSTGAETATLRLDTQSFTLSGSGNPPPPLPAYNFQGPTGSQPALAQPAIGLALNSAYPMTITGTLTISIDPGAFGTDPTVQFATGGTTVKFTIPANTTQALFGNNNSTQVQLQTGTVAGTINVTPSFQTGGGYDLTPHSPALLSMPVPAAAPQLLDIQLSGKTSNTLTLVVTGLATTRSLDQLTFQFTAAAAYNLPAATFPLNVQPYSLLWYNSSASQAYGSLFAATVSFTAQTTASGASAINGIQSVAVTATNSQGSSNSVSLAIN